MNEKKGNKKYILIIEGDRKMLEIYQDKNGTGDFKIEVVLEQDWDLKKVKKDLPDMFLMDAVGPLVRCLEILKEIKKNKFTAKIPVVVWSRMSQREDVKKIMSWQVNCYFIKNQHSLVEVIKKINDMIL